MSKKYLKEINKKFLSQDNSNSKKVELITLEDRDDLSTLEWIVAEGTKKGFERAKKVSSETDIILLQNGKLIRKRQGKPNEILSKIEERQVEIGQTTSI